MKSLYIPVMVLTVVIFNGCSGHNLTFKNIDPKTKPTSSRKITYTIFDGNITMRTRDFKWIVAKSNRGWRNAKKLEIALSGCEAQHRAYSNVPP